MTLRLLRETGALDISDLEVHFIHLLRRSPCAQSSSISALLGPRQANLVLIAYASSEGSGDLVLIAHASSESRGTFRQKARSLAPLNGWACAVKICHDGMLEDTNSLDGAHLSSLELSF